MGVVVSEIHTGAGGEHKCLSWEELTCLKGDIAAIQKVTSMEGKCLPVISLVCTKCYSFSVAFVAARAFPTFLLSFFRQGCVLVGKDAAFKQWQHSCPLA